MTCRALHAVFGALLLSLACSAPSSSPKTPNQAPDEATLCELELGTSTIDDALDLLGPPTTRFDRDNRAALLYRFGDAFLSLHFDERRIFTNATATELPHPSCWHSAGTKEPS